MNSQKTYVAEQLNALKGIHITKKELKKKIANIFGIEKPKFKLVKVRQDDDEDPYELMRCCIDIVDEPTLDVCADIFLVFIALKNNWMQIEHIEIDFF